MDFQKRTAIASILPKLFNQMIVYVMSAEVERFADQYYDQKSTQFLTVIPDADSGEIEIHAGKEFFDKYQREHREEEK